jgi:hypothetical protein
MPTNNPITDIYESLKQQAIENSLKEIRHELKLLRESEGNSKLIELEMYQAGSENTQKKMVSINTRYIVFVEDSDLCTVVHMSNGALLKVVEPCDAIMKLVEGDKGKSYIK